MLCDFGLWWNIDVVVVVVVGIGFVIWMREWMI